MRNMQFILAGILLLATDVRAEEPTRFIRQTQIPGTSSAFIVAEGEFEPRSIGSYSLRAYEVVNERFPHDNFVTGVVRPRDGSVEDVRFSDLDGDGEPEIIVIMRSAGTGSYISADGFRFQKNILKLVASVSGLTKEADPISALAVKLNKPDRDPVSTINETIWQWSALAEAGASSELIIAKPEKYTLAFDPAGMVNIRADCNMVLGTYTLEAQFLSINTLGPSTMAFCGEQSLDRKFLGLLGHVEGYVIDNDRLILRLKDDGGKMDFNKEQ